MRKAYWRLVHNKPCAIQHLLCGECREHGCSECLVAAFMRGTPVEINGPSSLQFSLASGIRAVPPTSTYTTGTTFTFVHNGKA
jgi:hypothetical protein